MQPNKFLHIEFKTVYTLNFSEINIFNHHIYYVREAGSDTCIFL